MESFFSTTFCVSHRCFTETRVFMIPDSWFRYFSWGRFFIRASGKLPLNLRRKFFERVFTRWAHNSNYRGEITPVTWFIRPFTGVITAFITSRGPPCAVSLGVSGADVEKIDWGVATHVASRILKKVGPYFVSTKSEKYFAPKTNS